MKYEFNNHLSYLRSKKGVTQKQLADFLGVSFQTVSKWETGASLPDLQYIPDLCEYFNMNAEDVLGIHINHSKEELFSTAETLLALACKACKYGLLSLEDELEKQTDTFLSYAFGLLISGSHKNNIKISLENKLKYGNYPRHKHIQNSMIKDVVCLWDGICRPASLSEFILSYFTDEEAEEFKIKNPLFYPTEEYFINKIKGKEVLSSKTALLENVPVSVCRQDLETLVFAAFGASGGTVSRIMEQMPFKVREWFMKRYEEIPLIFDVDRIIERVAEAQNSTLKA